MRVCSRCGSEAGDDEFCTTCGLHLIEQPDLPTRGEWEALKPIAQGIDIAGGIECPPFAQIGGPELRQHVADTAKGQLLKVASETGVSGIEVSVVTRARFGGGAAQAVITLKNNARAPKLVQRYEWNTLLPGGTVGITLRPKGSVQMYGADEEVPFSGGWSLPPLPRDQQAPLFAVFALAVAIGLLPLAKWFRFIDPSNSSAGVLYAKSLWTERPAAAAVIVAGALAIVVMAAYAVFRDSWDRLRVSRVAAGFSGLVGVGLLAASSAGLAQATDPCYATNPDNNTCLPAISHVGWGGPTAVVLSILLLISAAILFAIAHRRELGTTAATAVAQPIAFPRGAGSASKDGVRRDADGDPLKRCPDCAEWIKEAARVCRYCGHTFAT